MTVIEYIRINLRRSPEIVTIFIILAFSIKSWSQIPDWVFAQPTKNDTLVAVGFSGKCLSYQTSVDLAHIEALNSLSRSLQIRISAQVVDYSDRWDSIFKVFICDDSSNEFESYARENFIVLDKWSNPETNESFELIGLAIKSNVFPDSGLQLFDSAHIPSWITTPPETEGIVFGIGEVSNFLLPRNGWDAATKLAMLSLASTIESQIRSENYDKISGNDQQTISLDILDVNQLLSFSRVLSRYHDSKNDTYYVLVGISTEKTGLRKEMEVSPNEQ